MRVSRSAGIVVGDWPASPEVVALVEGAGALLAWDVLRDDVVPAARVHDPERASEWLWEVYGDAADAILGDADEVDVPVAGDWRVRDACRVVAQLNWAEAWWPASVVAGVPALDPAVLGAERAVAVSTVEHVLDDPDAVERALASVVSFDVTDPELVGLADRVGVLAEDYGVVLALAPAAVAGRSEFALAAGGVDWSDEVAVLTGTSTVDWTLVPHGVVDAAAPVEWAVVRRQGATVLEVSVAAGPRPGPLAARMGEVVVALDEVDGLGRITGSAPVPPTVLLLPPDRRVVTVYAPGFAVAPSGPGAEARRAAIIDYARSRVGSPGATLTERTAR
ncbi:hypothetical protein F4560_000397 [Saccharothrix ecbatanensis]|uniref:Uncharacterized protein n=1 Tax=Saccharothrix ecbatanensis TaxID=1105145 RepID=A0A7W9HE65_9PSEU|nr:hypothetical protein [Saccharothrix ecbatanensis]MBB5800629.1 hypothetical protein [Saccharothrix ecbatanensis]